MSALPRRLVLRLAVVTAGLGLALTGAIGGGRPAAAAVEHRLGYEATVAGWTSWYGSYGMGAIGTAWCIDHGIPAPDAAYDYRPTSVADHAKDTTRAMAWAVGRYGPEADRATAAALTLVLHDLSGALYPQGRLDVDRLTADRLSGFGGDELAVLARARQIKLDAVGHSRLVLPLRVQAERDPGGPAVLVRVTDAGQQPVSGAAIGSDPPRGALVLTDGAGRARLPVAGPAAEIGIIATVPDLDLTAFAPARTVAQRVARPGRTQLHLRLPALTPPPPPPSTTTTSGRAAPTTVAVTRAPTTAVPTTAVPTTAVPTTVVARIAVPPTAVPTTVGPTTGVASPLVPVAVASAATSALPVTGAPVRSVVELALGLTLLGVAALLGSRPGSGPGPTVGLERPVRWLRS